MGAPLLLLLAAPPSDAQIAGTAHDLSGRGWGSTEICIFCHVPHNAGSTGQLWNHALTTQTFQLYSNTVSSTFNATTSQPGGASKLCLSCHDGTVALDSFGAQTGTHFISGTRNLGADLRNDHPISFTYDGTLASADGGLVAPSRAAW